MENKRDLDNQMLRVCFALIKIASRSMAAFSSVMITDCFDSN